MARPANIDAPLAPRAGSWRRLMDLLGSLLILAVWLSLWAWVAVGVAAPLGRVSAGAARTPIGVVAGAPEA